MIVQNLLSILFLFSTQSTGSSLPSNRPNSDLNGLFSASYMIGMPHCKTRWTRGVTWGSSVNLSLTRVHATTYEQVSLTHPPIPITEIPPTDHVRSGQVGCTMSHIRVWRDAFRNNHSHILVLEDDVALTERLVDRLPSLIAAADLGALARGTPWHFIYLRAYATEILVPSPPPWHPSDTSLTIAHPAWGTAAYILSAAGVRYLLTRVTAYRHPLDVQIQRLQIGLDSIGAPFIALDACDTLLHAPYGCPENVRELSDREKGNCFYSASQAGGLRPAVMFPRMESPGGILVTGMNDSF